MTTIRATCPNCGEVDLRPDEIELTIVRADSDPVGPESHYSFACPVCNELVLKPADERIARLLTTGGVRITMSDGIHATSQAPVDVTSHADGAAGGPAFTYDDLLDFHLLLSRDGWFEDLLASTH